jgi:enterobacterial common antigen flippase
MAAALSNAVPSEALLQRNRHALESVFVSALTALSVFIAGVILARALGPQGRGQVAAHMAGVAASFALGSLGANYGAAFAAARSGGSRPASGIVLRLGLAAVLVTIALDVAVELIAVPDSGLVERTWAVTGAAATQAASVALGWLQGGRALRAWNGLRLLAYGLYPILTGFLWVQKELSVAGALAAYALPQLVAAVSGLILGRRRLAVSDAQASPGAVEIWRYARFAGVSSAVYQVNQRLDQLFLAFLHRTADLGVYASAVTLSSLAIALVAGLAQATYGEGLHLPALERRTLMQHRVALAVGCAAFCAVILSFFGKALMKLLFGPEFAQGAGALMILAWGTVFLAGNYVAAESIRSAGDSRTPMFADLAAAGVTLTVLPFAILRFGLLGAAGASTLAYLLTFALNYSSARRLFRREVPQSS